MIKNKQQEVVNRSPIFLNLSDYNTNENCSDHSLNEIYYRNSVAADSNADATTISSSILDDNASPLSIDELVARQQYDSHHNFSKQSNVRNGWSTPSAKSELVSKVRRRDSSESMVYIYDKRHRVIDSFYKNVSNTNNNSTNPSIITTSPKDIEDYCYKANSGKQYSQPLRRNNSLTFTQSQVQQSFIYDDTSSVLSSDWGSEYDPGSGIYIESPVRQLTHLKLAPNLRSSYETLYDPSWFKNSDLHKNCEEEKIYCSHRSEVNASKLTTNRKPSMADANKLTMSSIILSQESDLDAACQKTESIHTIPVVKPRRNVGVTNGSLLSTAPQNSVNRKLNSNVYQEDLRKQIPFSRNSDYLTRINPNSTKSANTTCNLMTGEYNKNSIVPIKGYTNQSQPQGLSKPNTTAKNTISSKQPNISTNMAIVHTDLDDPLDYKDNITTFSNAAINPSEHDKFEKRRLQDSAFMPYQSNSSFQSVNPAFQTQNLNEHSKLYNLQKTGTDHLDGNPNCNSFEYSKNMDQINNSHCNQNQFSALKNQEFVNIETKPNDKHSKNVDAVHQIVKPTPVSSGDTNLKEKDVNCKTIQQNSSVTNLGNKLNHNNNADNNSRNTEKSQLSTDSVILPRHQPVTHLSVPVNHYRSFDNGNQRAMSPSAKIMAKRSSSVAKLFECTPKPVISPNGSIDNNELRPVTSALRRTDSDEVIFSERNTPVNSAVFKDNRIYDDLPQINLQHLKSRFEKEQSTSQVDYSGFYKLPKSDCGTLQSISFIDQSQDEWLIDAAKEKHNKWKLKSSSTRSDALSEFEQMVEELDLSDEDLLDRADRRDIISQVNRNQLLREQRNKATNHPKQKSDVVEINAESNGNEDVLHNEDVVKLRYSRPAYDSQPTSDSLKSVGLETCKISAHVPRRSPFPNKIKDDLAKRKLKSQDETNRHSLTALGSQGNYLSLMYNNNRSSNSSVVLSHSYWGSDESLNTNNSDNTQSFATPLSLLSRNSTQRALPEDFNVKGSYMGNSYLQRKSPQDSLKRSESGKFVNIDQDDLAYRKLQRDASHVNSKTPVLGTYQQPEIQWLQT